MKRRSRISLWLLLLLSVLSAASYGYWRYKHPFGRSHCCETAVYLALVSYAAEHQGRYPAGESSPEASLSILYRDGLLDAYTLRGKSIPEKVVRQRLEGGQLLTPETCGWHYVEGLRSNDSHELALFWSKAELGHHGERLSGGGHIVWFIGGDRRHVPASEWVAFTQAQQQIQRCSAE